MPDPPHCLQLVLLRLLGVALDNWLNYLHSDYLTDLPPAAFSQPAIGLSVARSQVVAYRVHADDRNRMSGASQRVSGARQRVFKKKPSWENQARQCERQGFEK
jgi:hypothetical protein